MLSSKQRAVLRAVGNKAAVVGHIGKRGLSANVVTQVDDALEARELVKVRVLKSAPIGPEEAAVRLAAATGSETVHTLGHTFLLYRQAEDGPLIELPS